MCVCERRLGRKMPRIVGGCGWYACVHLYACMRLHGSSYQNMLSSFGCSSHVFFAQCCDADADEGEERWVIKKKTVMIMMIAVVVVMMIMWMWIMKDDD